MHAAWLRPLLAVLCVGILLAGCGKGASTTSTGGGPLGQLAPTAAPGAVSVTTRNTTRLGGADAATDAAAVARTVYPGLTPATRPKAVVLVDQRNWPAALAASALAGAPTGAPILYSDGNSLPDVSGQALQALNPLGAPVLGGAQVLRIGTSAAVPKGYRTQSLSAGRPAVAEAGIERLLRRADGRAPRQVIVVPANATPALAMPAAGLSAESGAPILFVEKARVPAETAAVLASLHRPSIYVIDSTEIGSPTLAELRSFGAVTEIAAAAPGAAVSAAGNAIALARFTDGRFGWGVKEPGHGLVFASAAHPLDAPAAASLSATGDYGPLLVLESPAQLPLALVSYLKDIQPAYTAAFDFRPVRGVYNHGWLIGDEHAISAVTQAEIDSQLEISPRRPSTEEPSVSQVE